MAQEISTEQLDKYIRIRELDGTIFMAVYQLSNHILNRFTFEFANLAEWNEDIRTWTLDISAQAKLNAFIEREVYPFIYEKEGIIPQKRGKGRPAIYGSIVERNRAHTKKKTAVCRGWRSLISIRDSGRDILISGNGVYAVSGHQKVWVCGIDGLPDLDTEAFLNGV